MESIYPEAKQMPLFAGLPDAAAEEILGLAQARRARAGEVLFRQRETPERLLLLVRGLVRMSQTGTGEEQTTLRLMRGGELLGCVAVIRRLPYPASATAVEESALLSWDASEFTDDVMKRYPTMTQNLLAIVSDRTKEMVERVSELSGRGLEERLAIALLRLARQAGSPIDGGIQIKMSTARTDLAALAGVGYFTISRVLSGWQKEGIVENGRQRIIILDSDRLAKIAKSDPGDPLTK